jgi:hypothetical protein
MKSSTGAGLQQDFQVKMGLPPTRWL